MNKPKDTTAQTPKDLLHDLKTLVYEAEKMMGESIDEHTDDAMEALRDRFHLAHERFSELYDGARKRVISGAKCTDESIRSNPYQAISIAAGIGLLLGLIVSRHNSK